MKKNRNIFFFFLHYLAENLNNRSTEKI